MPDLYRHHGDSMKTHRRQETSVQRRKLTTSTVNDDNAYSQAR